MAVSKYKIKYKQWNDQARSKNHPSYKEYTLAKKALQQTERHQYNLKHIKFNNDLMRASSTDQNKVCSLMKKARGVASSTGTNRLETSVGTYTGKDVLEDFTAEAEYMGRIEGESPEYDNSFYRLCIEDNMYIFEFKGEEAVRIPKMSLEDLEKVLFTRMKPGKAADIYHLTVEHLRNSGAAAKQSILNLVNAVLDKIYYLTCPQIKIGVSTVIFKGKKKPVTKLNHTEL